MRRWSSVVTKFERRSSLRVGRGAEFRHIIRLSRGMVDMPPRQPGCFVTGMRDDE
jgi:hypothetical protein